MGPFVLESEGGYRDVAMLEESDKAVSTICKLCGWSQELEMLAKNADTRAPAEVAAIKTKSGAVVAGSRSKATAKVTTPTTKVTTPREHAHHHIHPRTRGKKQ